jgi:hypothetical protein
MGVMHPQWVVEQMRFHRSAPHLTKTDRASGSLLCSFVPDDASRLDSEVEWPLVHSNQLGSLPRGDHDILRHSIPINRCYS